MLATKDFQTQLLADIQHSTSKSLQHIQAGVDSPDKERHTRLNVYRNNLMYSLTQALEDSFPVVKRLIGDTLFKQIARLFITQELPSEASLHRYGESYIDFLVQHEAVRSLGYLKDVAQIEWLYIQCFHGPDAPLIELNDLLEVPEEALAQVCLIKHPNAYLLHSEFPALDIWQANLEDEVPYLNLQQLGNTTMVFYRKELQVIPMQLDTRAFHFCKSLFAGQTIEMAWTALCEQYPADEDDSADLVVFLLSLPLFSQLVLKESL